MIKSKAANAEDAHAKTKTRSNKAANAEEEPIRERDAVKLKREEIAEIREDLADNAVKRNLRIFRTF